MSYISLTTAFNPGDHGAGNLPHCKITSAQVDYLGKKITMHTSYGTQSGPDFTIGAGNMEGVFALTDSGQWTTVMSSTDTEQAMHQWLIDQGHAAGTVI